jgi:hypothetical protein
VALDITRTRTKRYVGVCGLGECDFTTRVESLRVNAGIALRDHARIVHGLEPATIFDRRTMRTPDKELPPQERLADYADHYVVFSDPKPDNIDTKFGNQDIIRCLAYVFIDGHWKSLGDTPIFWVTVSKQIMEDPDDPLGGKLVKGTDRNANEWAVVPVPTSDKPGTAALKGWSKEKAEAF